MKFKNLYNIGEFINEAKKKDPLTQFKADVKGILNDMFAFVKKIKYEYDNEGYPVEVEFEIDKADFGVDYDDLKNDFTEGVLSKRDSVPVLKFDEKEEEKEKSNNVYKIKFKISKETKKVKAEKTEKTEKEERKTTKDSDEQLLAKLKSKKTSDKEKEKIIVVLKKRDVKFKNPFDEDYTKSDDDIEKEAIKKAKEEKVEEGLSAKQKKLPQALQDSILKKQGKKVKENLDIKFGTPEWNEKYKVNTKEEIEIPTLNEIVNYVRKK